MPKSPKKSHATADPAAIQPAELMEELRSSLLEGARALNGRIRAISKKLTGAKYNQGDASHLAWLTKQAAQIMGEVRKLEDQEQKRLRAMSPALVVAYLRQLEPDVRNRIVREIEEMNTGRSVLS